MAEPNASPYEKQPRFKPSHWVYIEIISSMFFFTYGAGFLEALQNRRTWGVVGFVAATVILAATNAIRVRSTHNLLLAQHEVIRRHIGRQLPG